MRRPSGRRHGDGGDPARRAIAVIEPSEVIRLGLVAMLSSMSFVSRVVTMTEVDALFDDQGESAADTVLASESLDPDALARLQELTAAAGVELLMVLNNSDASRLGDVAEQAASGSIAFDALNVENLSRVLQGMAADDDQVEPPAKPGRRPAPRPWRHLSAAWPRIQLTQRELDILVLLSEGLSNKQIAPRIGISEHGVKRHVTNVLAKLNCTNRTEAVAYALQQGLLA
ncbi:response regulator transcription factor [Catenulispora sp. NF23]|uniref:helix-turn-helix transcriptional regulator n=1 Tax=Catenulispora pinistramenti TaxID=2705254 RepID=UPI001BACD565|nr:response regulator transcription factor [Catenulispora pinistramenti]MBS2536298.1 response regulator transcription factor [Catenulispora pinistramenti]